MDVGDALRSRIVSELSTNVEKYFERSGSAEVRINPEGHGYRVDVSVNLASGQHLVSHGAGGDAHTAFDDALTKIEKRVRRYKRRLKNHKVPGGKASNPQADSVDTSRFIVVDGEADTASGEEEGGDPLVVAETETPLRTMTVAMAALELDLSGRPVLLFKNAAHGGLSVVYQRPDGNVGWIDPQQISAANGSGNANGNSAA